MSKVPPADCVSVRQAVLLTQLAEQAIYRGIQDGRIPCIRVNHRVWIPREWIDSLPQPNSPVDDYIEKLLADAPPLTDAQRIRLAELINPARGGAA